MTKYFTLLMTSLLLLASCSSLRKSPKNEDRVILDESNFNLINGKYIMVSKKDRCVEFEVKDHKTLLMHYNGNKTLKIKGKLKDGYFVLKRSDFFFPLVINEKARICLLNNGTLIIDHNQIMEGTRYVIIPFYENENDYNIEFEKFVMDINEESEQLCSD